VENRTRAWIVYTVLRLLFVVLAWFLIQVTTPIRGIWAIALAIVVSAVFSILLLGRQRDAMSGSLFGIFRSINDRIDAAAAKEDFDDVLLPESETETEGETVDQEQHPGGLEHRD